MKQVANKKSQTILGPNWIGTPRHDSAELNGPRETDLDGVSSYISPLPSSFPDEKEEKKK